jgi:hypothetical protein
VGAKAPFVGFVISARQQDDRAVRLLAGEAAEHERGVRGKMYGAIEVASDDLVALLLSREEMKVGMSGDQTGGPVAALGTHKRHRLRQLDDPVVAEVLEDPAAELVVDGPQLAEVTASVQEQNRVGSGVCNRLAPKAVNRRPVRHVDAQRFEEAFLSEPDRGVAAIAVIWEIQQGDRSVGHERDQLLREDVL